MPQPALELSDTTLPLLEELTEVRQQRRQRCEQGLVVFQLAGQLAAAPEALTWLEMMTQVCIPACQAIQLSEVLRAKAAGKTSARQTQTKGMLQGIVDQAENVSPDQVASQILALQTSLQASYQTTAMLAQLTLTKFLPIG